MYIFGPQIQVAKNPWKLVQKNVFFKYLNFHAKKCIFQIFEFSRQKLQFFKYTIFRTKILSWFSYFRPNPTFSALCNCFVFHFQALDGNNWVEFLVGLVGLALVNIRNDNLATRRPWSAGKSCGTTLRTPNIWQNWGWAMGSEARDAPLLTFHWVRAIKRFWWANKSSSDVTSKMWETSR